MIHALPPAIVAGELVRLQTRQRVVALTFDGGGNADAAKRVLAIRKRERVPGTFFLTGHFVRTYPLLSRAIGRRFPVANHTVDHLDLRRLSTPAATRDRSTIDSRALPGVIRAVRARGYRFVTLQGVRAP